MPASVPLGNTLAMPVAIQRGGEFRTFGVLHAMHRPERLRQAVQFDLVEHLLAGMACREAAVIGRMPILRGDHERERRLKCVRDRE